MRVRRLLLAAMLAAAPAAAPAQSPAAAQPAAPTASRAARALAELVAPLDLSVEAELAGLRAGFLGVAGVDADVKALEADYPGILAFVLAEMEPVAREQATRQWPRDVAEAAKLYESLLTTAEITALDRYYRTEIGQLTIRTMFTGFDVAPLVAEISADPNGGVSAKALATANDAAKRKLLAKIGPADHAMAKAMFEGMDMAKLARVSAAVQALSLKQANARDLAAEAVLDEVAGKAFEKFIAQHDAKR